MKNYSRNNKTGVKMLTSEKYIVLVSSCWKIATLHSVGFQSRLVFKISKT